uniref:Metalloendopeptidase n=1 Tax=Macrostomum lignano TaxID=282301 RepID=A0A1I8FLV9_9PLAT
TSSLSSLVINNASTTNSSNKQNSSTGVVIQIDDMLIPIEDLQAPTAPVRSDGSSSDQASSSSSNSLPSSSYLSCRRLWPKGRLYYRFGLGFPSSYRDMVRLSLSRLAARISSASSNQQLVTFVESNYFIDVQHVEVIDDHEFMHALGFYHEQSRPDRDSFVTVLWNNIDSDECNNFLKTSYKLTNDYPRYDYGSVMHYQSHYFSCLSGSKTLLMKNGSLIDERNNLSSLDAEKLSYTYSSTNLAYCSTRSDAAFEFASKVLTGSLTALIFVIIN